MAGIPLGITVSVSWTVIHYRVEDFDIQYYAVSISCVRVVRIFLFSILYSLFSIFYVLLRVLNDE
jgi:hypothetical protein